MTRLLCPTPCGHFDYCCTFSYYVARRIRIPTIALFNVFDSGSRARALCDLNDGQDVLDEQDDRSGGSPTAGRRGVTKPKTLPRISGVNFTPDLVSTTA